VNPAAVHGVAIIYFEEHSASNLRVEDAGKRFPQNVRSHA